MKMLAIDGNSILNRAFYGIKLLSNKKGIFTNAVTGFMNIYLKEVETVKPDCIVVAFDLKAPTFRHKAVQTYKANRKGMPDELAQQLFIVKDILKYLGVKIAECEGYEADDILGTISDMCTNSGDKCVILTGDKDSLQLINSNVCVRLITNKETIEYDEALFKRTYGFEPVNLIDLKALMGDSSDNISGVAGIGEKTATGLIQKFETIENLYTSIDNAKLTKSVYNKLVSGEADARQSKWLATINKQAPVSTDIKSYELSDMDKVSLSKLLTELEMFKLLNRLGLELSAETSKNQENIIKPEKLESYTANDNIYQEILSSEDVAFLFDYDKASLKIAYKKYFYETLCKTEIIDFFTSNLKKYTFNAKSAYKYAFENGAEVKNIVFDAQIAAYLIDPLSAEYTINMLCGINGISYDSDTPEISDISCLKSLCIELENSIDKLDMKELLYDIEQPLTEVLASMEYTGIKTDTDGVKKFGEQLSEDIDKCKKAIYQFSGRDFNISSPKQLGEVLFNDLKLPAKKKTKSGYSTNAEVLEELKSSHPIIEYILEYRQLTKLNSTYVDGLLKTVSADGRIHSVFKQTETRTGRISSTEPNMQNIPVKTERGREMRKFFVADEGKILLDADYSQIELRIMAHMCDDKNMQQAFISGEDIHTATAAQVFGVKNSEVTAAMRSAAKAVNFGIIYGIGAFSLSKDINVSVEEADEYIKNYFRKYPSVEKFTSSMVQSAIDSGYVYTMFKRRRNIPEIKSSNKILQAAGKRIAMNTPVQGSAADIIKIAMVRVYKRLSEEKLDARLILQVHDELIVEASKSDAEKASKILSEEMTNAVQLKVPLTVDVNQGSRWYDAKG